MQNAKEDRDGFFAEPVSAEYALHTNYHSVVQDPMDFQTMRAKISRGASRDSNRGRERANILWVMEQQSEKCDTNPWNTLAQSDA